MVHTTYHNRRNLNKQNVFQLSFYGENKDLCEMVGQAHCSGDASLCGEGEDDGDGNSRDAGGKREGVLRLVNQKGGALWEQKKGHPCSAAYLLHLENRETPSWKLRLVQGLTVEKYEKYGASPLHFACAARNREGIIFLLQTGSRDSPAHFYQHTSLMCSQMLTDRPDLQELFAFWSSSNPQWGPDRHHLFPKLFRKVVALFMHCFINAPEEH
eukprot:Sspe_Gene.51112::Locus_28397_Transcript_2_3_Confidence_0.333_Length_989::g.51112::m.51112